MSQAANKYWVGTSGGNFSDNANWSTTSGGANDTTAPGTNDVAYFTSGDVDNAIIDVDSNVNNFYMSSGYSGIITVASGVTLTTDVLFSQADGTFNAGDTVIALNGTTANTISGGTFNLQSADLNINYPLTVSNGIFDGGTGNITFSHAYADLTISGGNFTFPSGTTTIKDAFVISGSAVVQDNNSTIVHNCTSLSSGFCRFTFASSFTVTNFIVNHTDTFPTEIRSPGSLIVSSNSLSETLLNSSNLILPLFRSCTKQSIVFSFLNLCQTINPYREKNPELKGRGLRQKSGRIWKKILAGLFQNG